jgi:hypothetical protein
MRPFGEGQNITFDQLVGAVGPWRLLFRQLPERQALPTRTTMNGRDPPPQFQPDKADAK